MSIIFNGTEVTDIVMDGVNLDAVVYNGVSVFGRRMAFLKSGPDFDSYVRMGYIPSTVDNIRFCSALPTGITPTNQLVISKDDSPITITAYYVYQRSPLQRDVYIVPSEDAYIVFDVDCSNMFRKCSRANIVFDNQMILTSFVENMSGMFSNSTTETGIRSISGLQNLDTSKVTNMTNMFSGSEALTSLDVSNFDTSKVTNMANMFKGMRGLTSLDVSNFDTSKVTNMGGMFENLDVTSLDVSNFDTSKVTNMTNMFTYDLVLHTIYASEKFVTDAVIAGEEDYMFLHCQRLVGGAETAYSDEHADYTYARIDDPEHGKPGYFTLKT